MPKHNYYKPLLKYVVDSKFLYKVNAFKNKKTKPLK